MKLVVPRLVANLGCSVDQDGSYYLDNVDVGGVMIAEQENPFFIAGILNSKTTNFVFKRISKPFRGSYLSANKQFIAPLPIPPPRPQDRVEVARRAQELRTAHTSRRNILANIERRLSTVRTRNKPEIWLFPGLKSKSDLIADAPARLDDDKKREWADQRYELDLASLHGAITPRLTPGASRSARFKDGELSFWIDDVAVIDRIFVDTAEGEFIVSQWKAATFSVTEKTDGKKFCNALRKLAVADNPAIVRQVIDLAAQLSALEMDIATKECAMNDLVDRLYGLTDREIALVAKG